MLSSRTKDPNPTPSTHWRSRLSVGGICVVLTTLGGCGPDELSTAELRYRFDDEAPSRYSLKSQFEVSLLFGNQRTPLSVTWELETRIAASQDEESDEWTLKVTPESRQFGDSGLNDDRFSTVSTAIRDLSRALQQILDLMLANEDATSFLLRFDSKGHYLGDDRARPVFDIVFPLLPELPSIPVELGHQWSLTSAVIMPLLGDVQVTQSIELVSAVASPGRPGFEVKSSFQGEAPAELPQGVFQWPLKFGEFRTSGEGSLEVEAETGHLVSRELDFAIHAALVGTGDQVDASAESLKLICRFRHHLKRIRS